MRMARLGLMSATSCRVDARRAPPYPLIERFTTRLPQDGLSLVTAAQKPSTLDGRGVLLETFENPRGIRAYHSIRTARYRYDVEDDGLAGLSDFKVDPWEMDNHATDPAYARIVAILASKLEKLNTCRGTSCRVDVGRLPEPG